MFHLGNYINITTPTIIMSLEKNFQRAIKCSIIHTSTMVVYSNLTNQIAQNEVRKSLTNPWLGL